MQPNLQRLFQRRETDDWIQFGVVLIMALVCALVLSANAADPDLWGHVRYGRDALEHGLPSTPSYTYTAVDHRWINHEVITEYLLALGVDTIGPSAMLVIKSVLGLLVLGLMHWRAVRRGVELVPIGFTLLLVAYSLMHFWTLRPQLLSYIFFAWMILLLDTCFVGWGPSDQTHGEPANTKSAMDMPVAFRGRRRWLWLLVPLFTLWANSHGGFVAGYCILVAYFAGRSLEAIVRWGRRATPSLLLMGGLLIACALATLINPYGIELHRWLIHSLGIPRPEIVEWRPPELISVVWIGWWILVGLFVVSVLATRARRDPTQLMLLAITLWQACEHRRHIPFFAVLFGFWMPIHVQSLWVRYRRGAAGSHARETPRTVRWALALGLLVAACLITFHLGAQLRQINVSGYPVSAFQYMADHQLSGKLVVHFKWAQYAIAAFGAKPDGKGEIQVAFDGRFRTCYPQEIVDMYLDFAVGYTDAKHRYRSPRSSPQDGSRILRYKQPNLVLIDRGRHHPVAMMDGRRDDWILLYQDELAQLWGRKNIYDNPDRPEYIPPSRRVITDDAQQGIVAWPALPVHRPLATNSDGNKVQTKATVRVNHPQTGE